MTKLYRKLRGLMAENCDTSADVAKALLLSRWAVSQRLNGHYAWSIEEAYILLDRYHVPYSRMAEIFPKGGKAV